VVIKQSHSEILLVEDEEALIAVMEPMLEAAGYKVTVARTGEAAVGIASRPDSDLILIDLGLPDLDGKQVISTIRKSSQVPIVVISARDHENEKIAALDAGADDYVEKPFDTGELLARVRAILRRAATRTNNASRFSSGDVEIDYDKRTVIRRGEEIRLSPKEFDLLKVLALNVGKVVTRNRLLGAGWSGAQPDPQYLRTYIGMLRQKLERDPSKPEIILSEPGVGYRLNVGE